MQPLRLLHLLYLGLELKPRSPLQKRCRCRPNSPFLVWTRLPFSATVWLKIYLSNDRPARMLNFWRSFVDSWSSGSSREVCIPPGNPATWIKKDTDDETVCGSPDGTEVVSSSITVGDDDPSLKDVRSGQGPVNITQSPPAQTTQTRKAKVRTAFSEGQMNALTHRFSMQRYLTPAEMKTLAGLTGLTYKQVSGHGFAISYAVCNVWMVKLTRFSFF